MTFLQRLGGSINLNLPFHMIFLEGVYEDRSTQGLKPRFRSQEPPRDGEMAVVLQKISHRVTSATCASGVISKRAFRTWCPRVTTPPMTRTPNWPARWRLRYSNALPLASARVSGCGFSLHANTAVPAHRHDQLERLLRYTARGAVSLERLKRDANGDVLYPAGRREQVADASSVGATVPRWTLCSRGLNPPASLQHCARCIAPPHPPKRRKKG